MAENDAKCKAVFPKEEEEGEEDILKCLVLSTTKNSVNCHRGVKKTRKY